MQNFVVPQYHHLLGCLAAFMLVATLPVRATVPAEHVTLIPDAAETVAGRDGRFYGQTGTAIYYLTRSGAVRIAARFSRGPSPGYRSLGFGAEGLLGVGPDGAVYGATRWGGAFDQGVVYKMDRNGRRTTLEHFQAGNSTPAVYVSRSGVVYVSRLDGWVDRILPDGTVTVLPLPAAPYEYAETAQGELLVSALEHTYGQPYREQLYRLNGADQWELAVELGASSGFEVPHNLLAQPDGSVILLTSKLLQAAANGEVTVLHDFSVPFEGLNPRRVFQAQDGSLIGHTYAGGLENAGVIFRVVPATKEYTILKHLHAPGLRGFTPTYLKELLPLRLQATGGNIPPCAEDDIIAADRLHGLVEIDVLKNDRDADCDPLTIVAVGSAEHGTVAFDFISQKITYTPSSDPPEYDSFTYTIADGNGGSVQGRVVIQPDRAGRYSGELRTAVDSEAGVAGTLVGTLNARVNARGVIVGRLHLLQHNASFSGQFGDHNVFGAEVLRNPRLGLQIGVQLRLKPIGSAWEIEVLAEKNGQQFTGTLSVPPSAAP